MTYKLRFTLWLVLAGVSFFGLVLALMIALNSSTLVMVTACFVLIYTLIWVGNRIWQSWTQPLMQLTSYTQALKEQERNLQFHDPIKNPYVQNLLFEIDALSEVTQNEQGNTRLIEQLLQPMLDDVKWVVCLFDPNGIILFANIAAKKHLQLPALKGKTSTAVGFQKTRQSYVHHHFGKGWQTQTTVYNLDETSFTLFTATNIQDDLQQAELFSQQNLMRILSHELRNSLTPIASMADTLLGTSSLPEQQTRTALSRIKDRSERLMGFVHNYVKLKQLPQPDRSWFEFQSILQDASAVLPDIVEVNFHGELRCFADMQQFSQLMINLLKNANEATPSGIEKTKIDVTLINNEGEHCLTIRDFGPGFSNLDNVLTPFYTTKVDGSGIGLSFCYEIVRAHEGKLITQNHPDGGAVVIATWPFKGSQ